MISLGPPAEAVRCKCVLDGSPEGCPQRVLNAVPFEGMRFLPPKYIETTWCTHSIVSQGLRDVRDVLAIPYSLVTSMALHTYIHPWLYIHTDILSRRANPWL